MNDNQSGSTELGSKDINDKQSASNNSPTEDDNTENRRTFLGAAGTVTMVTGMAAGYGTLGYCALRYLEPEAGDENLDWQFVATVKSLADVTSREFVASSGVKIVIARAEGTSPTGFLALSSVCPHLGCQVFWESANDRFFCPCHNGVFDASGEATAGPPADAGQSLKQYPTKIQSDALYVKAPLNTVTASSAGRS